MSAQFWKHIPRGRLSGAFERRAWRFGMAFVWRGIGRVSHDVGQTKRNPRRVSPGGFRDPLSPRRSASGLVGRSQNRIPRFTGCSPVFYHQFAGGCVPFCVLAGRLSYQCRQ
jgi:hypothetical protein